MARTLYFTPKTYSDVTYVKEVANHNSIMERELYHHCQQYFNAHSRALFFCNEDKLKDIFQEAFITLWRKIETHNIYVEDNVLKNVNGKEFTCSLVTYFMSIAKLKNMEISRNSILCIEIEEEEKYKKEIIKDINVYDMLYEDTSNEMLEILSECISTMSERCNQILTMFYYEEKTLDDILIAIPTFSNKNALKTHKYKCMETLRKNAKTMYKRYINL